MDNFVYIKYLENSILDLKNNKIELIMPEIMFIKIVDNETFFREHDITLEELFLQFFKDFHRCDIFIDNIPELENEALFKYIHRNQYLKINFYNVLLTCTQVIMLFPIFFIYNMIDYPLIIAESDTRKRISVDITSDSIKIIKFLRAVQMIDSKAVTILTFAIILDIDFVYGETTITIKTTKLDNIIY